MTLNKLAQFVFRNLKLIGERDRLVAVRSWLPCWDRDSRHIGWPVMLVDCINYRAGVVPIWDWVRVRQILFGDEA